MLIGLPIMSVLLLILALLFLLDEHNLARAPLIGIFSIMFGQSMLPFHSLRHSETRPSRPNYMQDPSADLRS